MTNQNEIDKRIVEAAKAWAKTVEGHAPHMTKAEAINLFNAVEASKPKAARRGHLFIAQNSITDMPLAIEATDAVETRCGPTAGVESEAIYRILYSTGISAAVCQAATTVLVQLIADAQAPIEEKS